MNKPKNTSVVEQKSGKKSEKSRNGKRKIGYEAEARVYHRSKTKGYRTAAAASATTESEIKMPLQLTRCNKDYSQKFKMAN
ncbi:17323_t:CDS:2 [Gigaspora rosea]|nr:17323_t:CDS:2 [Gigaspora rosea]